MPTRTDLVCARCLRGQHDLCTVPSSCECETCHPSRSPAVTTPPATNGNGAESHACYVPGCDRAFANALALSIHTGRAHKTANTTPPPERKPSHKSTRGISSAQGKAPTKPSPAPPKSKPEPEPALVAVAARSAVIVISDSGDAYTVVLPVADATPVVQLLADLGHKAWSVALTDDT